MLKNFTLLFIIFLFKSLFLQAQHIELLQQGKGVSIRGLSIVDEHVAWVSGNRGYVARSEDGGRTWTPQPVKGFEHADFRDIEAFSDKEAIIMSSGTPALLLKTIDGGANWQVKYHNADTAYFFDAMDFSDDKHGYVLGDPVKGKFLVMETKNGGDSWQPFKNQPDAMPGEAAFAASGTCLRTNKNNGIEIVTGGAVTRLLTIASPFIKWSCYDLPLPHGQPAKGAFSIADHVIVGGNYLKNKNTDSISCVFNTGGKTAFKLSEKGPAGYQSCVAYIGDHSLLSTGTSGSNISTDDGKRWLKVDDASYNVCRRSKKGKLVLLAGDNGRIGLFSL